MRDDQCALHNMESAHAEVETPSVEQLLMERTRLSKTLAAILDTDSCPGEGGLFLGGSTKQSWTYGSCPLCGQTLKGGPKGRVPAHTLKR